MSELGKIRNQLPGPSNVGNCGGGLGSACVNENAPLIRAGQREIFNEEQVNRRSLARANTVPRRNGPAGGNMGQGGNQP